MKNVAMGFVDYKKGDQTMKLNDYVKWTGNTCAKLESTLMDNIHMLLGLVTEVAELSDQVKKNIAYKKNIDWINAKEEIGDIMYYLSSFCRINNFDLEEILDTNVQKLESRYPNKFTEYHALNRNLSKERKILEK